MNIIILNDFAYINGGAGKVALTSAIALARKGFPVTVFAAVPPVIPELEQFYNLKVICTGQFDILSDPNRLRAVIQGVWNFKAARIMSDLLYAFDKNKTIIHVHGWTKALSSSVVKVAMQKGFKVVLSLHDYFFVCPNGGFFDYKRSKICKLHPMSIGCLKQNCDVRNYQQKLWRYLRQLVQNKLGYLTSGISDFITVSEFSKKILQPYLPSGAKIYFVNNPIEIPRNKPVPVQDNKKFIMVGRLSKEKGPHLLAMASRMLGCECLFVGDGDCRSDIEKILPGTQITGWLSYQEVQNYLQTARALVLPSLLYETQGLVVAEAAAMGIPAVVPDTSAARDMVVNGLTGLWFRGGSVADLAKKIAVLQDAETARKMGQAAYERYWSNPYTMDAHINKLLEVYEKILSS